MSTSIHVSCHTGYKCLCEREGLFFRLCPERGHSLWPVSGGTKTQIHIQIQTDECSVSHTIAPPGVTEIFLAMFQLWVKCRQCRDREQERVGARWHVTGLQSLWWSSNRCHLGTVGPDLWLVCKRIAVELVPLSLKSSVASLLLYSKYTAIVNLTTNFIKLLNGSLITTWFWVKVIRLKECPEYTYTWCILCFSKCSFLFVILSTFRAVWIPGTFWRSACPSLPPRPLLFYSTRQ